MLAAVLNFIGLLVSWSVTFNNYIRDIDRFDVERCIALHNEIVMHGWVGSGRDPANFTGKNWFDRVGDPADRTRDRLSTPLTRFLEGALITDEPNYSFFYYVYGLSYPEGMWSMHDAFAPHGDPNRYLTLYGATNIASHPEGLVFDQWKNRAIIQMSIFDHGTVNNLRQKWYPLDVVLSAWLDMIKVGKVQAVPREVESSNGKFDPWMLVPYSQQQLEATIQSFNNLADAIESRMPAQSISSRVPEPDLRQTLLTEVPSAPPLLSPEALDAVCLPPGFAYSFLSKARLPSFRFIAPGLSLPSSTALISQPFALVHPTDDWEDNLDPARIHPLLIFPSSRNYEAWADRRADPKDLSGSKRPFSWPYSQVQSYPAGLYFTPVNRQFATEFEDSVILVLPFPIGGFGHARTSDGARFGENTMTPGLDGQVVGEDTFADLFQIGYNPFVEMHAVQLYKVLDAWRLLVESGEWKVDKDGVHGTVDVWRSADRGNKWRKYMIPIGW